LTLVGRDEVKLAALADELSAHRLVADATQSSEVEAVVAAAATEHGELSGVANCFGSLLLKPAHLTSDAELEQTLAIHVKSSFAALRAMVRVIPREGYRGGSLVLLSSAAARVGMANHETIAAAKGAIEGLALAAAATYASRGLRVNCVAPGLTRTPLTARITGNEAAAKASMAMHALGRFGEAGEIASAIAFLLDPEQSWITGQVLGVDGGLSTVRSRATG
jgi:NAD(P)-dependent dehydrogenase (short-subunit alcohol dehydrogenase family)